MAQNQFSILIADAERLKAAGDYGRALEKAAAANRLDPGNAEPVFLMGQLQRFLKNSSESVRLFKLLAGHLPDQSDIQAELAMSLWEAGEKENAYQTAKKAVALDTSSPLALEVLGHIASKHACWPKAVEAFAKLAQLYPDNPGPYRFQVQAHLTMFQFTEAAAAFQRVIDLEGMTAENAAQMARIYFTGRMFERAVPYYEKALELKPGEVEWLLYLARCKIQFGDMAGGEALVRQAIAIKPDCIHAYTLLHEMKPEEETGGAVALLEETLAKDDFEQPMEKAYTHVFLGRYYHKEKDFEKAFHHFKAHNDIRFETYKGNGIVYNPALMAANFAETKKVFSSAGLGRLKGCGSTSDAPVFIVAMPRSGTTLLEQIIASHSDVYGGGEQITMGRIFFELNSRINENLNDDIHAIIRRNAKAWAELYLSLTRAPTGVKRITDKMPVNFLHLGLIEALFPNARVIHIKRHPLDCCLSIFSNNFSESYAYTAKLETLGHYYTLYAGLMNHWKQTLSMKFLEIGYEDLVENQEEKSREILEFCGLEWQDRVLEFYKGRKAAFTISQVQVSHPINKRGVARWKPYEKHIAPLIAALDEDIVGPLGVKK